MKKENKNNVLIWGEHIRIKHFIFALVLSLTLVILTITLIDEDNEYRLLYGLISLIISFIVNVLLIKPKREVIIKEVFDNDN